MIEAQNQPGAMFASGMNAGPQPTTARDRPLVRMLSLPQLQETENARQQGNGGEVGVDVNRPANAPLPEEEDQLTAGNPFLRSKSALAGHMRMVWQRNKIFKNKVALRMLKCLRARRGTYSQQELASLENMGVVNIVWHDLTETKCRAGAAWIREVVMPPNDWPFALEPGSVPEIPPQTQATILDACVSKVRRTVKQNYQEQLQQYQQAQQQGQGGGAPPDAPSREEFAEQVRELQEEAIKRAENLVMKAATAASERMEKRIRSNMEQGGFRKALDDFIEDFVTFPAAIIKGPFLGRGKKSLQWTHNFIPTINSDPKQVFERVDPFDVYPAPWAADCQTGDFIERVRFTRSALYDCIGLPGYSEPELRAALRDYTNGHLEGWLWTEAERQRLQQDTMYTWLSPAGVIDGIRYWGSVPGWMLISWGIQNLNDIDPVKEYEINALVIGPYVVQCSINPHPLGWRPYRKACYDEVPGAFWGRSVPDLAETPQKMVNACSIALADNMGWASGFQTWVHIDRLADGESSLEVSPGRLWQLRSDPTQGVNPGIGFFQPNSNAMEISQVLDKWELKADDSTGIPRYVYGQESGIGGAADTYAGLSMLMNNAAKGLRRAISNIDIGILEPLVLDSFVMEMLDPKTPKEAKCDVKVVPSGAVSILIKEARNQSRINAATMVGNNPWFQQIVGFKGGGHLLKEAFESMEIPTINIIPDDSELEDIQKAQQQAMSQQSQLQMQELAQKSQNDTQKAQTDATYKQGKLQLEDKAIDSRERIAGAQLAEKHGGGGIGGGLEQGGEEPQPASAGNAPPANSTPPSVTQGKVSG